MSRNKKRIIRGRNKNGFRSNLEEEVLKKLPKKRTTFETEKLKYFIPKTYIPDFVITDSKGKKIYLEVKGYFRYEDQQKMRYVKMSNPELDIRMYFPRDDKVHGSKMTNSQWCKKYGFPYAIGHIPRGWLK